MMHISPEEHERVLAGSIDVPLQRPSFPLPLPEVGISGKTVWVKLPQGLIPFQAKLEVSLSSQMRGIHMSRMEEVVSLLHGKEFGDLREYALELGREMLCRQGAGHGRVRLAGQLPLVRTTQASGRTSLDTINVSVDVNISAGKGEYACEALLAVGVNHITACPCTQSYNQALFNKLSDDPCPLATHSQRSHTTLSMGGLAASFGFADLLGCLESALHVTQDLLKRPDEAELVLRSHAAPQFAEDAVREVARQAGLRFGSSLVGNTPVIIESLSLESIHIHDVCCRLETDLAEIMKYLPPLP